MSRLVVKPELALDVDLDPQALAVEAVLVALVLAEHRVEALVEVLVGAAPGVVDAHRVVGRDRARRGSTSAGRRRSARGAGRTSAARATAARISCSWATKSGFELTGRNIGLRDWGLDGSRGHAAGAARGPDSTGPSILPAMHEPEGARPRARSPFAAAFLSLIFPGLGQLYAGAPLRALAFAAAPILALALGAGIVLRLDQIAAPRLRSSTRPSSTPSSSSTSASSSTASSPSSTPTGSPTT